MDYGDGDDFDGRVVELLVVATAELLLSGMLLVSSLFVVAAAAAAVLNEVGQRGELQHLPLFRTQGGHAFACRKASTENSGSMLG